LGHGEFGENGPDDEELLPAGEAAGKGDDLAVGVVWLGAVGIDARVLDADAHREPPVVAGDGITGTDGGASVVQSTVPLCG
jgi:hypothetical protein